MDQIPIQAFAMEHKAMLLKAFAMIGGDKNDGVLKLVMLFEVGQQPSHLVIYESNRGVIRIDCVLQLGGRELYVRWPIRLVHRPLELGKAVKIYGGWHERFMHVEVVDGDKERFSTVT